MRKSTAFVFALCGTALLVLLFIAGRLIYINMHEQTLEQIAGSGVQSELRLAENDVPIADLTERAQIDAVLTALGGYTYTEYPKLLHPSDRSLGGSTLTVTFDNESSIGVSADGFVFVDGKLRDVEGSRGKELYHKLYVLFYPNAE